MQPVIYLLVRIVLTWLQYLERDNRAFLHGTQLVLVAGAAHCWAVVYALFVAVLARASRHNYAGHKTYEDMLPGWVSLTERVAAMAMVIWWLVGCLRLLVHMAEDDAKILPFHRAESTPSLLLVARSSATRVFLAFAQAVSCAGLFISVVALCFALLFLEGEPTVFELGLVFVASSFAVPLAIISVQRLLGFATFGWLGRCALAAATESAAFGPQFCVILALMDIRDHTQYWTTHVFPSAAATLLAAIISCAYNPPRLEGVAVPPENSELWLSALLDVIGVAALTLCFSVQNAWVVLTLGIMAAVVAVVCVVLTVPIVRESLVDLLDTIMPLRDEFSKAKTTPGPWRDCFRVGTRVLVLASAVIAFWDIAIYASAPTHGYVPQDNNYNNRDAYEYNPHEYNPAIHDLDEPPAIGSDGWPSGDDDHDDEFGHGRHGYDHGEYGDHEDDEEYGHDPRMHHDHGDYHDDDDDGDGDRGDESEGGSDDAEDDEMAQDWVKHHPEAAGDEGGDGDEGVTVDTESRKLAVAEDESVAGDQGVVGDDKSNKMSLLQVADGKGVADDFGSYKSLVAEGHDAEVASTKELMKSDQPQATGWLLVSDSAACEKNNEGIVRTFGTSGYSLETCKIKCLETTGCRAIDFYTSSGWCNLFDAACSAPQKTQGGAASYKYQAPTTETPTTALPTVEATTTTQAPTTATTTTQAPTTEIPRTAEAEGWSLLSASAACEANNEGIVRTFGTVGYTLETCKDKCLQTAGCRAIDFYRFNGWCNLFDRACSAPQKTQHGASSYQYQAPTTIAPTTSIAPTTEAPTTEAPQTEGLCPNSDGITGYEFSHKGYFNGATYLGKTETNNDCAGKCSAFAGCVGFSRCEIDQACYVNTGRQEGHSHDQYSDHYIAYTKCQVIRSIDAAAWSLLSDSAACEVNNEGIVRTFGAVGYTLETCRAKCLESIGCSAIDFYKANGWCNLFDAACSKPQKTQDGATSYKYQAPTTEPPTTPEAPTTEAAVWSVLSDSAACEVNDEGIVRTFGEVGFNLETCKAKCLKTTGCRAVDFYTSNGWCNLFDAACSVPRKRHAGGVVSYKYQAVDKAIAGGSDDL